MINAIQLADFGTVLGQYFAPPGCVRLCVGDPQKVLLGGYHWPIYYAATAALTIGKLRAAAVRTPRFEREFVTSVVCSTPVCLTKRAAWARTLTFSLDTDACCIPVPYTMRGL